MLCISDKCIRDSIHIGLHSVTVKFFVYIFVYTFTVKTRAYLYIDRTDRGTMLLFT